MTGEIFTHGTWRAKDGMEDDFIAAWKQLGAYFAGLAQPPTGVGTLIQNVEDPREFFSFGPWGSLDAVRAMREDPRTPDAIGTLMGLCEEAKPGAFRVVAVSQ